MNRQKIKQPSENPVLKAAWYKKEAGGSMYYTYEPPYVYKRAIVGDGSKKGTPEEVLKVITDDLCAKGNSVYSTDGVYTTEVEETDGAVELPPGTYVFKHSDYPLPNRLVPVNFRSDTYVEMPHMTQKIMKDFTDFIENEAVFRELGRCYKATTLLYGPGGTGKSALIRHVVNEKLPKDAVTICLNYSLPPIEFSRVVRETLGDRLKVWILEEFTHFCENELAMEGILTFLDGENSIDKSFIFATTNYPEVLPHTIVSRPSRVAYLHEVGYPEPNERKLLLEKALKREASQEEIDVTKDMTADCINEICLLTHIKKIEFMEAKKQVDDHLSRAKKSFNNKKTRLGI